MKKTFAGLACFTCVLFLSLYHIPRTAYASDLAVLERVEMMRDRGYDYLDIYTSGAAEGKGLLLDDKLYIDFPGAKVSSQIKLLKKKSKRVKALKIIQKDENTAQVVITLKKAIDYDVVNVFGRGKTVVEIGDRLDNIFAAQIAEENRLLGQKGQPLKPVKLRATADGVLDGKTIILDPGHGGSDPGANPQGSVPEKTLNLQTAQITAQLLRAQGADVILTRNEDRRSNLHDLMEYVNQAKADIFISFHYNSIYNCGIAGSETYYYNPVSRQFAETMHEAVVRELKRKDRGLHRIPFYVVKNADIPSVLLEPVYLTCPEERDLANSVDFREKLAQSVIKGVKNYFRNKPG